MVVIHHVQRPSRFYTLTLCWSTNLSCYFSSLKCIFCWYYMALTQNEEGLQSLLKFKNLNSDLVSSSFFISPSRVFCLPLSRSLDRRATLCQTAATLKCTNRLITVPVGIPHSAEISQLAQILRFSVLLASETRDGEFPARKVPQVITPGNKSRD